MRGYWVVKKRTARDRVRRALANIAAYCRLYMHAPLREQWRGLTLKLRGHYGYFAVPTNSQALWRLRDRAIAIWRKRLGRRSQNGSVSWAHMRRILRHYPLPTPTGLIPRVAKP